MNKPPPSQTHDGPLPAQLYGLMPVLEALRAGQRRINQIILANGVKDQRLHEIHALARQLDIPVKRLPRQDLGRLCNGANHQGVIATLAAASYAAAADLLARLTKANEPPLALVLDGVEDPRNFGAIIRTAECAGIQGIFVPERRAVGLTEVVAKSSAGALEHIPVARVTNLTRLLGELKAGGLWVVGADAKAKQDYTTWDWTLPSAIVMGGEGAGLHRLVRENCDILVNIPLFGKINSLNVSVAAGIIMFEARRQRLVSQRKD